MFAAGTFVLLLLFWLFGLCCWFVKFGAEAAFSMDGLAVVTCLCGEGGSTVLSFNACNGSKNDSSFCKFGQNLLTDSQVCCHIAFPFSLLKTFSAIITNKIFFKASLVASAYF